MGVAIPTRSRQNKVLPSGYTSRELKKGTLYHFPITTSAWQETGEECLSGMATDFFTGQRRRKAAAFMGSVPFDSCGTTEVTTDNVRVYSNVYRPIDGSKAVSVTCTCPIASGAKCQPAATLMEDITASGSKRILQGSLINSRALTGRQGTTLVTFTRTKQVFRFDFKQSDHDIVPWPATCSIYSADRKFTKQIIIDGCSTSENLAFEHHYSGDGTTIFSTAPILMHKRHDHMHLTCELVEIYKSKVQDLLNTCPFYHAPKRLLAEEKSNKQSTTTNKKVSVKTGEPFKGLLSAENTHLNFDRPLRESNRERETQETRSRVNVLSSAIREGRFGEFDGMVKNAEEFADEVRESEQIGAPLPRTVFNQFYNQIVAGPAAASAGVNRSQRSFDVAYVAPIIYMEGGLNSIARGGYYAQGVHNDLLNVMFLEGTQTGNVGFAKKLYGVNVDASTGAPGSAYEVRARNVDVISALDSIDRAFGQRVAVRNFGFSFRRDLDDIIDPADSDFGTEVYVQYRTINVALGSDILDTRYYISIGMLGVNVVATRDFDSYATNLQINWGRGWQIFLESDFPDDGNLRLGQAVGVGRPNRMYLAVGAGVGEQGLPVAAANLQTPHSFIGVGWLERNGERIQQYSITAGRYTYLWENTFLPDNIQIPQL